MWAARRTPIWLPVKVYQEPRLVDHKGRMISTKEMDGMRTEQTHELTQG